MTEKTIFAVLCAVFVGTSSGAEYFADANNGNDAWDGTASEYVSGTIGPKKTVGAAVELANADGVPSVVTLLPGTYDEGEYFEGEMTNRIVITQPHLKLQSKFGKETVFLVGNHDKTGLHGLGTAAVRVIYIADDLMGMGSANVDVQATNVVIEGVTICNGATIKDSNAGKGGGVFSATPESGGASLLIDCVVSNCSAYATGGALFRQNAYRTLFADNYAGTGGSAMAFGSMAFCVVAGNKGESTTYNMRMAVNCTFAHNEKYAFMGGWGMYLFNCLSFGNANNGSSPNGNVHVYYYDTVCALPMRLLDGQNKSNLDYAADPSWFAHSADYGWRLLAGSPAIGKGYGYRIPEKAVLLPPGYAYCDYNGNPVVTSGRVDCGAVQSDPLMRCVTEGAGGGISVEGANIGTNILTEATEITVVATEANSRPFVGFEVDGVMQPIVSDRYALQISDSSKTIRAVYGKTWHVDAVNGSDSNFGGSSGNAKKTIRAATTNSVAGDVVLVAPGTYGENEGVHFHSTPLDDDKTSPINVGSRVLVPYNVTVRSTEGAQSTIIVGRKATSDVDAYGNGPDAVRCAMLEGSGSVLDGFTLTGGHTSTGSENRDDNDGGAIIARSGAVAKNCIITNNFAARSGAGLKTTFVNCRIMDNTATVKASVGRECSFYRCIIDHNKGPEQAMQYFYDLDSCTVGQNNTDLNLAPGETLGYCASTTSKIVNSIVIGPWALLQTACTIRNCAFTARAKNVLPESLVDCIVTNLESLAFDSEYRPVIGSNVAIDMGDSALVSYRINDVKDLLGAQRVMNGRMDAGAIEADWRPIYAKCLGGNRLAVTSVSPEVSVTDSNQVCMPKGALDCELSLAGLNSNWFYVDFDVTGTGTLNVYVDGVLSASCSTGRLRARFSAASDSVAVRLEYVPGNEDEGEALIYAVRAAVGTVVLFR